MKFDNRHDARKWFLDFKPCNREYKEFIDFENGKLEFGDWILFRITNHEYEESRPILAIFVEYNVWDMALVLNYIEKPRAWEYSHEVITNKEINYSCKVACLDRETQQQPVWMNQNIIPMGNWKVKPTISQLKEAILNGTT